MYNHPYIKVITPTESITTEFTTTESTTSESTTVVSTIPISEFKQLSGASTAESTTPDTKPVTPQLTTSSDYEPALNTTSNVPTSGNITTAIIVAGLLVLLVLGLIALFTGILFLWRYDNN